MIKLQEACHPGPPGSAGQPIASGTISPMRAKTRPIGFSGWRWDLLGHAAGRTLEIGCGFGANFGYYPKTANVTAFDVDPLRVHEAARAAADRTVRLTAADAQRLAFPDGAFDTVAGTLVFCSIPDPALALGEIRRVLKPGGRLLLVDHVRSHHHWLGAAQDALAPAWLAITSGCNLNRDTEATVRRAGFEIEQLKMGWGGLLKLMVARQP